MKILHVITRLIRGGADENTIYSCNGQVESGHKVYLLYGSEVNKDMLGKVDPRVELIQVKSLVRSINPSNDVRAAKEIKKIISSINPNIVHTHTSKAGILGRLAARLENVPIIIHGVHILPFLNVPLHHKVVYWSAEKILSFVTDKFINVSDGMKRKSIDYKIGVENKHVVIPSGMDVRSFMASNAINDTEFLELLPEKFSNWSDAKILIMVAAFEERKRHIDFIRNFKTVCDKEPNTLLLLAGAGPLEEEIKREVNLLGLQNNVVIIGFRADISRWIKRADICVLSSSREGLPRVIVQYAICGKPIVSTYLPGVDAVIQDQVSGYIVNSVSDMVSPIIELLDNHTLYSKMCLQVQTKDFSAWSVENMNDKQEEVYNDLRHFKLSRS